MNPSGTGASNFTYAINESSNTDDDEDDDDASSPPRQTTTNHITTNDLIFDRPPSNTPRYPHPRLPRVVLRQSSPQENDNNTTTTTYGSLHDSPSTSFTTPSAANFFVGSLGGTTDNTNISARSVIEDVSDIETDETDERMHSVLTDVEINQAYVPDDETTDGLRTNL
jgi:hypothetical protein